MKRLFIDLETTGTNSKLNAIHQICGYVEINGEIKEKFDIKLKPFEGAIIEPEALIVCDKTLEELNAYQDQEKAFYQFIIILKRYVDIYDKFDKYFLVGYNIGFDLDFLLEFFKRNKNDFLFAYIWGAPIDVISQAMIYLQHERHLMNNFKQSTVAEFCGIPVDESKLHDAEYDIYLTRELFYVMDCHISRKFK